ncbi:Hypothetical predicted protein [Pelobates cultripes]|uniref:Uncharacterized protein n=1 Tax=Pelobates cultripes TaxID=61616 RepID=A0AAD1TAR0_PELCU|nr:Hypothetical predicted protein [Pelobates cultripes]
MEEGGKEPQRETRDEQVAIAKAMAPSKQTKLKDTARHVRKDRQWQAQEDNEAEADNIAETNVGAQCVVMEVDHMQVIPDEGQITKIFLKQMLQDLRATIKEDFTLIISNLHREIAELGDRNDNLEVKADDLCLAHIEMDDKPQKIEEENTKLWHKIADLEDRARRNNARFRGIPESVSTDKFVDYILNSMCSFGSHNR